MFAVYFILLIIINQFKSYHQVGFAAAVVITVKRTILQLPIKKLKKLIVNSLFLSFDIAIQVV